MKLRWSNLNTRGYFWSHITPVSKRRINRIKIRRPLFVVVKTISRPKINQVSVPIIRDNDIIRSEITVNNAFRMDAQNDFCYLPNDFSSN